MARGNPQDFIKAGGARELSGVIEQRLGHLGPPPYGVRLIAHATSERASQDSDREEYHQREQFVRLGDRERIDRLDEEKIIREKRQQRRDDSRPQPQGHRAEQNRRQKDHRQVRKF